MDFFSKVSKTITSVGKDAVEAGKGMADIAKMKIEIKSKEDFIERQYIEIGKKVYETEKDSESSAFEEIFAIKQTLVEIEDLQNDILEAKGYTKCEKCGANMSPDAKFCPECGASNDTANDTASEADDFEEE